MEPPSIEWFVDEINKRLEALGLSSRIKAYKTTPLGGYIALVEQQIIDGQTIDGQPISVYEDAASVWVGLKVLPADCKLEDVYKRLAVNLRLEMRVVKENGEYRLVPSAPR